MQTLIDVLDTSASQHGSLVALKQWSPRGVRSWSYTELAAATKRVAATLQRRGIQHGDRVILWGPSGPDWVAVFFGCLRAGAILVPLDLRSKDEFLARVVDKTKASYIVAGHDQSGAAAGIGPEVLPLEELAACAKERASSPREARFSEEDVALVVFTSGTTGAPKGVVLRHRNLVANLEAVSQVVPCTPDFRLLSLLPLSHMFELTIGLLAPLRGGASITYVDSLQPASIFQAMKEEGVTCMACVPQILQLFMAGVEREVARKGQERRWRLAHRVAALLPFGLRRHLFQELHQRLGGRFQFFVCGGAHLDSELAATWERVGIKVLQGYGMTEAAPVVTCDSLTDREPHCVGRPVPRVEVKLAGDGEVLVRGPNLMSEYWEDTSATESAFEDGWYRTGDIGSMTPQGRLKLIGRKKNIIVLANGMNVYPEDVEEVLKSDPRAADAVVVGVHGEAQEVQVHAVLLMKEGQTAQEVVRGANRRLAPHQQVRGFTVWPEPDFPRTNTLKPKREEILGRMKSMAR